MKKLFCFVFLFLFILPVFSAETDMSKSIKVLLSGSTDESYALLDSNMQNLIKKEQLQNIIKSFTPDFGKIIDVTLLKNNNLDVIFENGTVHMTAVLNKNSLFSGFRFISSELKEDSFKLIINELKKIGERQSFCILKNGKETIQEYNADAPLPVGSSFKLTVLKALNNRIKTDQLLKWSTTVRLKNNYKSLPSGILQDWPENTPITVATLANLMISASDNTATDHLIYLLKREEIEKYASPVNQPFLSTREFFALKLSVGEEIQNQWHSGVRETRNSILNTLNSITCDEINARSWNLPYKIYQFEWFYSTKELCSLIYELKDLNAIKINAGGIDKKDWHSIGYKGGSEPGIINMTFVVDNGNESDCFSFSITATDSKNTIDTLKIQTIAQRVSKLLKKTSQKN